MDDPREPSADPPERSIGGHYRLGPVIGRGGMATIHRAVDERSGRPVAVKLLRPEVTRDADLAQRFRREALAATVLRHPNIVACLDTGTDGDQPYLVMELIEGEDLAARLRRGGRLAPGVAARIGLDVARALGAAHLRGIVHRDIKPGNILLAADGRAMVTDFGIARLAVDAESAVAGTTLGSVHYFSPEQARGVTTTPASDVYGLGLVLYEMLTGRRAWTGATTDAIALARVGAPAPSPRAEIPEVSAALDAVVRRALAPEAADRFPHGAAVAAALEPMVAADDPRTQRVAVPAPTATAPPAAPIPGRTDVAPPIRPMATGRRGPRRRATSSRIAAAALGVVAVLAGAMLVAARPDGPAGSTDGDGAGASATDAAIATAPPSPPPTSEATPTAADPTAQATTGPTASPAPEPVQFETVADVCEPFFGLPCGLGPGRYTPARFAPPFSVELGDGWSTAFHAPDLVAFTREEGGMTFASSIAEVYPNGGVESPRDRARPLIESFIATDGVSATRPAGVRLDGRKGLSVDLTPIDGARIELFATATERYALEPDRTTRIVVIDVRGRAVLLAIEPNEGFDLRGILETADVAAGTIDWR